MAAPTLVDAKRAGAQLVKAGASRVLLFGSVANGEARLESDIDLVAIFDDIDYRERLAMQLNLRAAAEKAVDRRVEVLVTDWPEWKCRTEEVTASFEAAVAGDAVVLFDREPGEVAWDKEIGLPDNNDRDALDRLAEAANALGAMARATAADEHEMTAMRLGNLEALAIRRHWRLIEVCSDGAMATETALKAMVALDGGKAEKTHEIDELVRETGKWMNVACAALSDLERNTVGRDAREYGDVSMWRSAGTYIKERSDVDLAVTSRLAPVIAEASVKLVSIVADELVERLGDQLLLTIAKENIENAVEVLTVRDLVQGCPVETLSQGDLEIEM